MVKISMIYEGGLHCRLAHGPSGSEISTDAPKDNQGKGEAFSPTDLVASALGACILTTMAIYATRHSIELAGAKSEVIKEMVADPARRIGKITVDIHMPAGVPKDQRPALERVGNTCPVHKSLHPDVQTPVTFHYPD
jgi:putative redox protein